jgi:hypothetical protein
MKINSKFIKQNSSNEIKNKIHQMKLKTKLIKQNSSKEIENKIQTKNENKFK